MHHRQRRRAMKAQTRHSVMTMARQAARTAKETDATGRIKPVTDPAAIGALTRAFAQMIRSGGRPITLQISGREAQAFPNQGPAAPGTVYVVVAALANDGCGCFAVQGVTADTTGLPEDIDPKQKAAILADARAEAYRIAENMALDRLREDAAI